MTHLGHATALAAMLPPGAVKQLCDIWESRENCQVLMDFGGGRCTVIRITRTQRFQRDDFNSPLDNVGGQD